MPPTWHSRNYTTQGGSESSNEFSDVTYHLTFSGRTPAVCSWADIYVKSRIAGDENPSYPRSVHRVAAFPNTENEL